MEIIKGEKLKCSCEDAWFCEVYKKLYLNPEYCINYEKLEEIKNSK